MRKNKLLILMMMLSVAGLSQTSSYHNTVREADTLFAHGKYETATRAYSTALSMLNWKGLLSVRYKMACAWAQVNMPDSAFAQLFQLATQYKFKDPQRLENEKLFDPIKKDGRWDKLSKVVLANKQKADSLFNKPLAEKLDKIYDEDQKYRTTGDWEKMMIADSINQVAVISILDKYGWLSQDEVGKKGNAALFLVIQHADIAVQEKYLPMVREAVQQDKALRQDLALLEDRILMRQEKKQVYGSQIVSHNSNKMVVYSIEDPKNVDKRRAEMGLESIADYLKRFGLTWNAEEHL